MDDCPISFGRSPRSRLNPSFVSGTWVDIPSQVEIRAVFSANMDTSVTPANGSWDVELNGIDRAVDTQSWEDNRTLLLTTVGGIPGSDPVTLELLVEDEDLHRLGGASVLPFGPETIPAA